jgi:hypothetical protein
VDLTAKEQGISATVSCQETKTRSPDGKRGEATTKYGKICEGDIR